MKNILLMAVLYVAIFSSAFASTKTDYCKNIGKQARQIMHERQFYPFKSKAIIRANGDRYVISIVNDAYHRPMERGYKNKNSAIVKFAAIYKGGCKK